MSLRDGTNRAFSLIYAMVAMVALTGFVSLAVDFGRVEIAKTELQQAADAAALYGASGLSISVSTVKSRVATSGAENKVDGKSLTIDTTNDLDFGLWDPSTKTFTVLTGSAQNGATAIRVTAHRSASRGTGVPTFFASLVGRTTVDVTATSIASRGSATTTTVNGNMCPWLAGMPSGSTVAATGGNPTPASAPTMSPVQISGLDLTSGNKLVLRQTGGTTSYINATNYGPDGETDWIVNQASANGINNTQAPIQSLVGIFLDNRAPNTYSAAASLDFSTTSSRDFSTLSPGLKQVFFIGDGLDSSGDLQQFVVPSGATRLYLGIMDENGWWWDNTGSLTTTMMDDNIQLVK